MGLYLLFTFFVTPFLAPLFGRERIKETDVIEAHSFIYPLLNRNYVKPELNQSLQAIASDFSQKNPGLKLIYLDANFPFFDGFPLLPHLSHSDGKKIDVSLIYTDAQDQLTNLKPSVSGYGVFEAPREHEFNQRAECIKKGYWQYEFSKYLSLGHSHTDLKFSEKGTKSLVKCILNQKSIHKLFIEPHLKKRIKLDHPHIRFHGCQAVRHDDHIHFQL